MCLLGAAGIYPCAAAEMRHNDPGRLHKALWPF